MVALLRTNATVIWLVLVTLTVVSWLLGTDHGFGPAGHVSAGVTILAVAVFKVRLVGLYFMDLKAAPTALRGAFEGYCAALFTMTVAMFLWG